MSAADGLEERLARLVERAKARDAEKRAEREALWQRVQTEAPDVAEHAAMMRARFGSRVIRLDIGEERVIDTPKAREVYRDLAEGKAKEERILAEWARDFPKKSTVRG